MTMLEEYSMSVEKIRGEIARLNKRVARYDCGHLLSGPSWVPCACRPQRPNSGLSGLTLSPTTPRPRVTDPAPPVTARQT